MFEQVVARIEQRLKAVNLSASAASLRAGLSQDAIRNMRRAARGDTSRHGVSTRTIAALAPILDTSVGWLLEGISAESHPSGLVPVIGIVGRDASVEFFDQPGRPLLTIAYRGAAKPAALEIRSGFEALPKGWFAVYDDLRVSTVSARVGQLCVVGTEVGTVLVRRIKPTRRLGFFQLLMPDGIDTQDMPLAWAAPVRMIVQPES